MLKDHAIAKNEGSTAVEMTRGDQFFLPQVDIYETDEELVLYADVPGVAPKDVDLRFEKGELILQGRVTRPERKGKLLAGEYREGDFYRVFQVHESINSTKIDAECNNGVLTVHLPKEERVKPRKVQVKGTN
jgi:HSP20 family protein